MNLIFRIRITRFRRTSSLKCVSIMNTISHSDSSRDAGSLRSLSVFVPTVFQFLSISLSRFNVPELNYHDTGWNEVMNEWRTSNRRARKERETSNEPSTLLETTDKSILLTDNSNYITQSDRRLIGVGYGRWEMEEKKNRTSQKGNRKKIMRSIQDSRTPTLLFHSPPLSFTPSPPPIPPSPFFHSRRPFIRRPQYRQKRHPLA